MATNDQIASCMSDSWRVSDVTQQWERVGGQILENMFSLCVLTFSVYFTCFDPPWLRQLACAEEIQDNKTQQ